ncbi:phosphatidylglycerophosphatase A, partial [Brevibacillus sp. SIMBA_076]
MKDSNQLQESALQLLRERGVTIDDIADLVHFLQKKDDANLEMSECRYNV